MSDKTTEDHIVGERVADLDDARRHLDPVVDHLDHKFADAPPDHVAEVVETVFSELSAEATIPDHLAALTQRHAQQQLAAEAAAEINPSANEHGDSSIGDASDTPSA